MTKDTVYLFIQVVINTKHKIIHEAIQELQEQTHLSISSTPNVQVLETKIIELYTKN